MANSGNYDRKKAFKYFAFVIVTAALLMLLQWLFLTRGHEYTDNAYVAAPQIQLTAQVDGVVSSMNTYETQEVKAGQRLIGIDPTEAKITSAMADAELLRVYRTARATVLVATQRKTELQRIEQDWNRRSQLTDLSALSQEETDHLRSQLQQAQAAYQESVERSSGITQVEKAVSHPDVEKAKAAATQAYVSLLRTQVISPVDATVAKRNAHVGQRVGPSTPVATLVIHGDTWVDANFKEDQLGRMRKGQEATLEADVYGSSVTYKGKVIGFSPATGANMSLLPAQNATGNWVKVVQRLPVRIALDPLELKAHPLQLGLSMNVTVDTSKQNGEPLNLPSDAPYARTTLYEDQLAEAEKHVSHLLLSHSDKP
jgi:membrane fusion protein (multidrug efflux system)